jgi:predicted RNA-binding Zn ribbon-like protein
MGPADRDLLLQFLWTQGEADRIDTAAKLKDWLTGLGLISPDEPVTDEDVRLARHFRAATRALCAANNGSELDPRTSDTIDTINAIAPLQVTIQANGDLDIKPGGSGVPRALSTFLALSYKATAEGEFPRFKACQGCGWSFYDQSKNGSKKWCDMGLCGTRSKMKAYRERKKAHG